MRDRAFKLICNKNSWRLLYFLFGVMIGYFAKNVWIIVTATIVFIFAMENIKTKIGKKLCKKSLI